MPHIFLCELVNRSQDKFVPISIFSGKVFFWGVLVVAMIKGGNASKFNLASQNSIRGGGGGCSKDMLVREGSVQTVERQVLISWDRRSS